MKQVITIPENIEYVSVELVDKNLPREKCEIISGFFKGSAVLENDDTKQLFILTAAEKENTTNIYNTKYYNLVSITILGKSTKAITYFTLSDEDQNKAIEMLKNVVTVMKKDKRMLELDPDIIDMSTYSNLPNDVNKMDKATPKISTPTRTATSYTPYERKEPSPSVIKRTKTKKRTKKELSDMINKIKNIKDGVFVVKLPTILEDIDDNVSTFNHYMQGS